MTPVGNKKKKEALDKGGAIRERHLGCKSIVENFDGRIDCDHVSGLT